MTKDNSNGVYLTQKTFEDMNKNTHKLIEVLNHRMTKLEVDVKWIRIIGAYMAMLLTSIAIKSLFF